jgi:phosphate transport system permease protein
MLVVVLTLIILGIGYRVICRRALCWQQKGLKTASCPAMYGLCALWLTAIPLVFLAWIIWYFSRNDLILWSIPFLASFLMVALLLWFKPSIRAHRIIDRLGVWMLAALAAISILITISIVITVFFESWRFFQFVSLSEFLFGLHWSPQTALRADQAGSSGSFGAIPVFSGTLLITVVAMSVAIPFGLLSAIYLSGFSSSLCRRFVKPALELLAGIPTVVYGYVAAMLVGPFIRQLALTLGLDVSSESALAAGLVMGIMIIPFVLSLTDDVMHAVPTSLRDASLALGSTQTETIQRVILPAALPGIVGAVLLAISRAIGETMIVTMAAGVAARLTWNPLDSVTTVTTQMVTLLVGDQEFDSPKTLAAFALGMVLFFMTLILNVIALLIVKRYRERYE